MLRKFAVLFIAALLLSAGWLGGTGFTLFVGFLPLLWISESYGATRRDWWCVFGWALLQFVLWNALTVWWIWFATPVGPPAATLASSTLNMIAFMLYHTVVKRAPRALAYVLLVAGWIATEYWYTVGEFSWPWLILGNGFSHDVWAVQWYEYTGVFGGSLWVLTVNLLLFETWRRRSRRCAATAAAAILLPLGISLALYCSYEEPERRTEITIVQPNVDPYEKFNGDTAWQEENLFRLAAEAPADTRFIVMPETALPGYYDERTIASAPVVERFAALLAEHAPQAMVVTGGNTLRYYDAKTKSRTARQSHGYYYDVFNSAIAVDSAARVQIHHKGRLVIGVEKTPTWIFDLLDFLVIDLGGTLGQLGVGRQGTVFTHDGMKVGASICYEGLYGDFFGDFVRRGAEAMLLISNDGWWGDTPGYRHLFTISRLRAVEHRRAIARSANTGRSGFIDARGRVGETLGWEERGTLTASVALDSRLTFYTRYGDYIGRIAEYVMLLCVLYFVAYRVKRRNYLVQ